MISIVRTNNITRSFPYKCKVLCPSSGIEKCFEFGCCMIILNTARFHSWQAQEIFMCHFSCKRVGFGNQLWTQLLPTITHTLVPSAPTILAVEAASSTSISVKWAACTNDGGSPIIGYVVEHRSALDPESPFEMHLVGEDVYTTVDGLTPSTKYEVRVRVENAVGRSQPSVTMETKTKDSGELKSLVILKELLWMSLALLILQLRYNKHTCINKWQYGQ